MEVKGLYWLKDNYIKPYDIDESKIHESSCAPVNEIDLLIRTGGDKRIVTFYFIKLHMLRLCSLINFGLNSLKKISKNV